MCSIRHSIPLALVALLLVLPMSAGAQVAGEPEMVEDPIEAMEPEINLAAGAAGPADDDVVAMQGSMPQVNGIADTNAADTNAADTNAADANAVDAKVAHAHARAAQSGAAIAPMTSPVGSRSGQLPFTGADPGLLVQLFLVGSVMLAGGIVSLVWASVRTDSA